MNAVQERAARRIEAIEYSSARIRAKIEAGHPRTAELEARLAQYETSLAALALELKLGKPMRVKGGPTGAGVEVSPPTGGITLEGK